MLQTMAFQCHSSPSPEAVVRRAATDKACQNTSAVTGALVPARALLQQLMRQVGMTVRNVVATIRTEHHVKSIVAEGTGSSHGEVVRGVCFPGQSGHDTDVTEMTMAQDLEAPDVALPIVPNWGHPVHVGQLTKAVWLRGTVVCHGKCWIDISYLQCKNSAKQRACSKTPASHDIR